MKRIFYIIVIVGTFFFPSCNYLDVVPENDVKTLETIFEQRSNADKWLKTCHTFLNPTISKMGLAPALTGADEVVALEWARNIPRGELIATSPGLFLGDGLQTPLNPIGDLWHETSYYAAIRYCNIFIDMIGLVQNLKEGELSLWTAEVKAIKAHYYFELLRRYGSFILVPENIPVNSSTEAMMQPRNTIDECVNAIVELLDDAIAVLPSIENKEVSRTNYHSLESAATLKAMTLLYAASPLYNGNELLRNFRNRNGELLFPAYDKEKWRIAAEAIDEAIALCEAGGFELISGYKDQPTKILNIMKDIEQTVFANHYNNKEAILCFRQDGMTSTWFKYILNRFRDEEKNSYLDNQVYGALAPSIKMVEMFYTEHGVPISEDKQWMPDKYSLGKETDERYKNLIPLNEPVVLNLHLRREPRFYANIAADRTLWYRKQKKGWAPVIDEATPVNAYQPELFGSHQPYIISDKPQNPTGYWIKKHTNSDFPFSTYSSDYHASGEYGDIIFRMPDLYLASAEAWNEYLDTPNEKVYNPLNKVRERAGILNVEEAWATYAKNPQKVKTQAGMREIIHQEWNIEFMFEGRRFYNLRRWMTAHQELNEAQYGWNVLGKDATSFYNNFEGPIVVWSKRKFVSPRDYFFPIRTEEIMKSGNVQNPGW